MGLIPTKKNDTVTNVTHFQCFDIIWFLSPRALPWAVMHQPFGLRTASLFIEQFEKKGS